MSDIKKKFKGSGNDFYTLFYQSAADLTVNGKFEGSESHAWITQIGIQTGKGSQVMLKSDTVQTLRHEHKLQEFKYGHNRKIVFDDVLVEIKKDNHERHTALVHVKNGPSFKGNVVNNNLK